MRVNNSTPLVTQVTTTVTTTVTTVASPAAAPKRGRGRPRKNPPVAEPQAKRTVYDIILLDCSGSMGGDKIAYSQQGVNHEIDTIKTDGAVNHILTYVPFDQYIDARLQSACSITGGWNSRKPNTPQILVPAPQATPISAWAGGGTPLYEAIFYTIEMLEKTIKPGDGVFMNIYTDGDDTSHNENYRKRAADAINRCKANGWAIAFVGTEQDVRFAQNKLNVEATNTIIHQNTGQSMMRSMKMSASARTTYSAAYASGASADSLKSNLFSKELNEQP